MTAAADFPDGAGSRAASPPRAARVTDTPNTPAGRVHASAAERLDASRSKLHAAMFPPPPPLRPPPAPGSAGAWRDRIKGIPAVAMALDTLQGWWSHHPMRPMAQVAREASDAAVRPMAQTHPFALVLSAAAAGAAIGWLKPWRWLFGSALFAGLVPRVASKMLLRMPIESWMGAAGAALRSGSRRRPPHAPPHHPHPTEGAAERTPI